MSDEYDRVIDWEENNVSYVIHLRTNTHELDIEVEEKYSGEMWHGVFSADNIEELTERARGPKKFSVFTKMLISSLNGKSESVKAEILSYLELQRKIQVNNPSKKPQPNPEQLGKKFIILTYLNEFDKMQYPIPLKYEENIAKLKFSIKRLAQELELTNESKGQSAYVREISLLKQENELLRNRIRKVEEGPRTDKNQSQQPERIRKELLQSQATVDTLKKRVLELESTNQEKAIRLKECADHLEVKDAIIRKLQIEATQNNGAEMGAKIEKIMKQMGQLGSQLQYSREQEKKSRLKIGHLEKELQGMMTRRKKEVSPDSDAKSERSRSVRSIQSGKSNKSNKSSKSISNLNEKLKKYNQASRAKPVLNASQRKPNVYDSDTESSRMRKMTTGRSSPFRQPTKTPTAALNRSRTKSKGKPKKEEPSERKPTGPKEAYRIDSDDSDSDELRKNMALAKLYEKRQRTEKNLQGKEKPGSMVENKIRSIEEMIRSAKTANRQ